MSVILSDDQYEAIRSYARSNMLNLIATGSPSSSVFRGQERTGIKITDNPAHFCLYVTGKDEAYLYSIGKNKNDNVSIFNRICNDLKNLKSAEDYKLEPFYHNVTKQPIILINLPENDNEDIRKKLCFDINEVVNNAYRIQLGELFLNNHIISAVTEDFFDFGIHVRKSFDLAVKYINEYYFFLKQYQVIDKSIITAKMKNLEEYSIAAQVSILRESVENLRLDNIETALNKIFIEMIKPSLSIETCNYTINLLNKLINCYNSILKSSINELILDSFIFIEDLKNEAVKIFKYIAVELCNKNSKTSFEINKVKKFIEDYFHEKLTIAKIADYIGFNKNYLCKKFKDEMGVTIHQYLISIRIDNSKKLLVNSNLSTEKVAFESGFDNVIYFRTLFKKHTGLTPTAYREYYSTFPQT